MIIFGGWQRNLPWMIYSYLLVDSGTTDSMSVVLIQLIWYYVIVIPLNVVVSAVGTGRGWEGFNPPRIKKVNIFVYLKVNKGLKL